MYQIPLVDLRGRSPVQLLETHADKARALLEATRDTFGVASRVASYAAFPFGDFLSRRWLRQTKNSYLPEIEKAAEIVGCSGVMALNLCYEWGCTSGAYQKGTDVILARVLDWAFPALDQNVVIALQSGPAGEFYNVTWPGMVGVITGMAPQRFAVALNQAPMRRHRLCFALDWTINRFLMMKQTGLPPMHLLRQVFETSENYAAAKEALATTPVALPVVYTLTGIKEGEGCVIERTENDAVIHELCEGRVCAANHFESRFNDIGFGWRPRPVDSAGRLKLARSVPLDKINPEFGWLAAPILNANSRLAVWADAAHGSLSAAGIYGSQMTTSIFKLEAEGNTPCLT